MRGVIKGFSGSMGSGLAVVHFEEGGPALVESGHGMRQIAGAFGSLDLAIGQEIEYEITDYGVMSSFDIVAEEVTA